jgi:hypothetical protein
MPMATVQPYLATTIYPYENPTHLLNVGTAQILELSKLELPKYWNCPNAGTVQMLELSKYWNCLKCIWAVIGLPKCFA